MFSNLHTHTTRCRHAFGTEREYIEAAITQGIRVLGFSDHGSTFGGNPVCCAGALSILERIDDALLSQVREKSAYIVEKLNAIQGVKSVSGKGFMLGIETEKSAGDIVKACMEKGLLVLTAKTKVRLLPALNISYAEIDKGLEILKGVIEA